MDKQKEKTLVSEAEKFLQKLLDENKLDVKKIEVLSKKLQKVTTGSKKKEENKKDLSEYLNDKTEVKDFLEQNESNYTILVKACQKILSKSQPQPTPVISENKKETKKSQNEFKVEKKDLIEIFNKKGEENFKDNNSEKLFVYFEYLSQFKIEPNNVPLFTLIFFPKEKKINIFLKCNEKINLNFSQVDYLCNNSKELFLNIDYFSIMGNNEVQKTREYKENCIDMAQFEKLIKEIPMVKGNDLKIINIGDDFEKFKKEFKDYCFTLKDKIKNVVTNNKEFFNEIVI